jgi:hypothetical protein
MRDALVDAGCAGGRQSSALLYFLLYGVDV